jgi:hypothetical protein
MTMLNVLLLLDCDECRIAFSRATVCNMRDQTLWQSAIEEMKNEARFQGWYCTQNGCLCEECVKEECERAKWTEEQLGF